MATGGYDPLGCGGNGARGERRARGARGGVQTNGFGRVQTRGRPINHKWSNKKARYTYSHSCLLFCDIHFFKYLLPVHIYQSNHPV